MSGAAFVINGVEVIVLAAVAWTLTRLALGLEKRDEACRECRDRVVTAFENHAEHAARAMENNTRAMERLTDTVERALDK